MLCAVAVAAAVVVAVAVTRSGGSGGGTDASGGSPASPAPAAGATTTPGHAGPTPLDAVPAGCDLLLPQQVAQFVRGHVHPISQDGSGVEKGCSWDNSHDPAATLATITVHATVTPDEQAAHRYLGETGCHAPGARPRTVEGVDETCVDTTLASDGVTVHARYGNVVLRLDYQLTGAASTGLVVPALSLTRSVCANLLHTS